MLLALTNNLFSSPFRLFERVLIVSEWAGQVFILNNVSSLLNLLCKSLKGCSGCNGLH